MGMPPNKADITVLSLFVQNPGGVPLSVFNDEAESIRYYRDIP